MYKRILIFTYYEESTISTSRSYEALGIFDDGNPTIFFDIIDELPFVEITLGYHRHIDAIYVLPHKMKTFKKCI